ncbi:MAG: hypothetical protein H0X35_01905 [Pseudonocardiales bacterium]|nr:hypothetical protein [Pseudonocardiales bacterium]
MNRWWVGLTVVLACGYLWIGAGDATLSTRWPALAGGVLVLAGLALGGRSRPLAMVLLVVGALVPVVTAWWSLVVPLTAVLIILCATMAVRSTPSEARHRAGAGGPL